ncbi:putative T7SS-secreted protein [Streptomyces sp. NPDC021622]|uniref:putative T7SS-secreted protein n=1 Tax=Streptomyces sp. NPDC021622 TaxID=3155013 RepID=UPI0033F07E75
MARRPVDWSPLSESDPTPGDPVAVRQEAKRLSNIAETLARQVKKLRELGDDDNIKGKYAKSLKEESDELAGRFDKTKGRYEKVSGHLNTWADELEHAQGLAKKARDKAQADEKDEEAVEEARKQLFTATSHYYSHAISLRTSILEAIDDAVEDSMWDDLVAWAKEHADGFKLFLDVLSWIGTALAIAAIFIPGLNFLVIGLGFMVLAGRFVLVKAGKATWMDLAFDAFGLVTMGLGRGAMIGLKAASKSTRAASTVHRVTKLKDGVAATRSLRNQLANRLASATDDGAKASIRQEMTALRKGIAGRAGRVADEMPPPSKWSTAVHLGDSELASVRQGIKTNKDLFGEGVSRGAKLGGNATYSLAMAATYGGTAVDWGDKLLGDNDTMNAVSDGVDIPHKPSWDGYNDFKASHGVTQASSAW